MLDLTGEIGVDHLVVYLAVPEDHCSLRNFRDLRVMSDDDERSAVLVQLSEQFD